MLDKTYDAKAVEPRIAKAWEAADAFAAGAGSQPGAETFAIVIPPPNVTGSLHMGHALNNTLQDVLIRWRRMSGDDALWMPGTDHAGIATQMVVERMLAEQGLSRQELGREEFIRRVWQWKEQSGGTITGQLRRLGASLDWPRERFTMDEGLSEAVREVFVRLYREGLLYRDRRLVNWDPKFLTAISDLEVESREVKGHLWHLRYPVEGEPGRFLVVATTRPETMLGDTAVAVHPEDARFRDLVGKRVVLPLVGRSIPVVADAYSDPEKGSGAVKITPAHDFNDFELGKRHDLPMPSVLDAEGRVMLDEIAAGFVAVEGVADLDFVRGLAGVDRFAARKAIIARLEEMGLVEKIEPHTHAVPHGDRSGVPIEPRLTMQWYVDAKTLAQPAIKAVETGQTVFTPKQWENTFFAWMRDIQPWCVSRQLWWGHQIPAWYAADGEVFVAHTEAEAREQARARFGRDVALVRGEGATLWDSEGNAYVDMMSNYGVNVLGHAHPAVTEAIARQAGALMSCHQSFASDVRAQFLETLVGLAPEGLARAFLSISGTAAIEGALKFARAGFAFLPGEAALPPAHRAPFIRWAMFALDPVYRLSTQSTSCPAASSRSQR